VFLDRDGVILEDRDGYVRSWDEARIYPEALEALLALAGTDRKVIVITNQAGVGHGLLSPETAEEINRRLVSAIRRAGGRVDGVYMCPHTPDQGCSCRKPQPGLILQAAGEHRINLAASLLIGDALSDLRAGRNAGVGQVALVRSGRGRAQLRLDEAGELAPFAVYDTLAQAVADLIVPLRTQAAPARQRTAPM
jgi:D-glycero-D-manno-heptose 1,7-bisphosphate phosphatase